MDFNKKIQPLIIQARQAHDAFCKGSADCPDKKDGWCMHPKRNGREWNAGCVWNACPKGWE